MVYSFQPAMAPLANLSVASLDSVDPDWEGTVASEEDTVVLEEDTVASGEDSVASGD